MIVLLHNLSKSPSTCTKPDQQLVESLQVYDFQLCQLLIYPPEIEYCYSIPLAIPLYQ